MLDSVAELLAVLRALLELLVLDVIVAFPVLTAELLTTSVVVFIYRLDVSTARLVVSLWEIGNEVGNEDRNEVGKALLSDVVGSSNADVSIGDGKDTDGAASVEAASVGATAVSETSTVKGSPQELVCADAIPRREMRIVFCSSDCFILAFEVVLLMRYPSSVSRILIVRIF